MAFPGLTSLGLPPRSDVTEVVARLTELDVFPGASTADIKKIAMAGTPVTVPANWPLMTEQTPADKAYIVLRGRLSVRHQREEIAQIGEGELVGEMAIVHHQLRSATVVAATDLEVLHFTREAVQHLRDMVPAFRDAVEATALERTVA